MKVLVSGGAGFIGSHLCERLLDQGHQVTALDNLLTGSVANISHLQGDKDFRFWQQDVQAPVEEGGWDAIMHLASPASPVQYQRYPIETMLANSLGTYNLLRLACASRARFLLASTSEVYGDPKRHPQPETYWGHVNPVGPRACYDEGKRFAEALTITFLRKHGLNVRIVRIFNTYGPRSQPLDGRVIPNFAVQALRNEAITVYGDGLQTRSFCYVSDLVEGLARAMQSPKAMGEVINLGNPEEHTILEVAELIKAVTGSPARIVKAEAREEEIARRRPNIAKARRLLGWRPTVPLDEGLRKTVAWFKAQVAVAKS